MKGIGGKFKLSLKDFFKKNPGQFKSFLVSGKEHFLTFSGKESLRLMIKMAKLDERSEVLLPSYLCEEILKPFKESEIKTRFYKINRNLEPDLQDIKNKFSPETKALLVINYFGFLQKDIVWVRNFCGRNNIFLIEDTVQSFLSGEAESDFSFNSYIKYLPIQGSLLSVKDRARKRISFKKAPLFSRFLLNRVDFEEMRRIRRGNFLRLLKGLGGAGLPLFPDLPKNVCPLGFPILSSKRDKLKKYLIDNKIYPPIHWELPEDVNKEEFSESREISQKILTIPIDQRYGIKEMDYAAKVLKNFNA